jgi:hypothetical protein
MYAEVVTRDCDVQYVGFGVDEAQVSGWELLRK